MICRLFLISFFILLASCSKDKPLYEPRELNDGYKVYQEGHEAFEKGDFFYAQKKFSEAELSFETVEYASKASMMASYCLYGINFYTEALENIEKHLKKYPADKNIIYSYYLRALIYFEKKYPNTDYAIDLKFKKDLAINQMAAKELYIAKYYISVKKWIPAINRLKKIISDYEKTIFIEEALHRLVEIYYHIGLEDEAKKYAIILGYNYNSSKWFEQTYIILNKDYKLPKTNNDKDKDNLLKRIIKKIR